VCMSTVFSLIYMLSTQNRITEAVEILVSFSLFPVSSGLIISVALAARKVIATLRRNIDYALHASTEKDEGKKKQYVASIVLVKAVPFYGYNVGWRPYCKVYLFDPRLITRLSKLLSCGAIMKQKFLIYEAHINYILQFLTDFNLYGCGYLECHEDKLKYRKTSSSEHYELTGTNGPLEPLPEDVFPRHSYSGWEVDICALDILNRNRVEARNIHQNFEERHKHNDSNFKYVSSVEELWKANGCTSNQPWTMPPTIRSDYQVQWTQEQEFRERLSELLGDEQRSRSTPGFRDILHGIPGEKYIPTAFESIDYMSSFRSAAVNAREKSKRNAATRENSVLDLDMDAVRHLNSGEDYDFLDLNAESEAEELLEEDIESQDEELRQSESEEELLEGNAVTSPSNTRDAVADGEADGLSDDRRTRLRPSNVLVHHETTHLSQGMARASEHQQSRSVSRSLSDSSPRPFQFAKALPASATLLHGRRLS
jgi:DNA polymerase zeta